MKKILSFICALTAIAQVHAEPTWLHNQIHSNRYAHGLYIGVQLGHTTLHNQYAFTQTVEGALAEALLLGADRLGIGAYLGYRFNDYLGAEINSHILANMEENGGIFNVKNHTRVYSIDLLGKFAWPLCKHFSPFVKGGASYVSQDILSSQKIISTTILYQSKTCRIMPAVAAGFDVYFTKSLAIDASWTHWFKNGPIHDIDFPAVGISYTFGN